MTPQPSRISKHILFALLLLSYFFSYFFRVSASVVLPNLQAEWGLSAALVGFISSMYFYSYAIMQPFCGVLNDRFGPVRIVGFGMTLTCLGSVLFGLATSPSMLILGRLLQGIGLSPMISGLFVYQGTNYLPSQYTFLSGITLMTGNLGAVVSVYPLSTAMSTWGRYSVFSILGVVTLLIAAGLFLASAFNKTTAASIPPVTKPHATGLLGQIKETFGIISASPDLKRIAILWAMTMGSVLTLQGLWAVAWFDAAYAPGGNTASLAASMVGVGVMAGNLLSGRISLPGKNHRIVQGCIYATTASWLLMLLCFGCRFPLLVTAATATLVGLCTGVSLVQFASVQNALTPAGRGGGVFGLINTLNFIVTIVFQWGSGALISLATDLSDPAATGQAYLIAHGAIAACMLFACFVGARIKVFRTNSVCG